MCAAWQQTVPDVFGVEKCFVRKVGFRYYVDLHVVVSGDLTVRQGHLIAHAVADQVRDQVDKIAEVLVHIEPEEELLANHPGELMGEEVREVRLTCEPLLWLGWVRGKFAFQLACCPVFQTYPAGIRQLAQDRDDIRENQVPMFHRFIPQRPKPQSCLPLSEYLTQGS